MAFTRKIVLLFICSGVFVLCIIAGYVGQREYQASLDAIVSNALTLTRNRADLPLYFHQQDKVSLHRVLAEFLYPDAAISASAYSGVGKLLAGRNREASRSSEYPTLESVRGDTSVTDTSLTAYSHDNQLTGTGFWSSLLADNSTIHLATPVFSPINPLTENPALTDFTEAFHAPGANKSLVVIGYVQVAIDRYRLLHDARPVIFRVVVSGTLLLMTMSAIAYLITRRATARLNQLTQFAGRLLSGESPGNLSAIQADEFINITRVLNNASAGVANHRNEVVLEHKLLKMQAEERASRLSQRESELNKAVIEISSAKQELHRLANYDSLTSLPNRHLFAEQLDVLLRLCSRNAKQLAVLFLNLNNFHRINESLGRSTGDLMLQEVAKRLVSCLRSSDMLSHYINADETLNVSRLEGDEFAVVLGQLDNVESAGLVAQRVIDKLIEPMQLDGHELVVAPRIGIAVAPRNGLDVEALLKAASTAMHHAKSKNGYLFYNEDMEAHGDADLQLESDLRRAIEREELRLHYQPQVDTTDGSIVCAEALLRWEHPTFGWVSPARFIALAERMGLILELGDWALVEACRQMKALRDEGIKLSRIAINVSPQQMDSAFVGRVKQLLESSGLAPSMLELGLSEAVLMANDTDILGILQELKAAGVYLSLENFGTLHAPLFYLSRHPLDEMKIDRSFVADCDKRKDGARLVKAIIAMADSLGIRTVAEGVETAAEYRFLVENGVTVMRGYLFSKPVPADELRQLLVVPWHFMSQLQRMALLADLKSTFDS